MYDISHVESSVKQARSDLYRASLHLPASFVFTLMDFSLGERSILEWDEDDVHAFFTSLGFPQYEGQLKGRTYSLLRRSLHSNCSYATEHNISGDVLCMLDSEGLKSVGVTTIGQRLAILKAVWQLKITHNIPIEEDHYVPPCQFCSSIRFD